MSFTKYDLTHSEWTLVANNVTSVTFQNASQFPVYINFANTALANTAILEDVGLVYGPWQGELKKTVTELTYKVAPNYVYAKMISRDGSIIIETD